MNNLSWLLYAVDAGYNIVEVLHFFVIVSAILFVVFNVIRRGWAVDEHSWDSRETRENKKRIREEPWIPHKKFVAFWIFLVFFLAAVPDKETVYMIAASEAGEYVVNTPEAQEVLIDLKEILEIQLEKLKQ